MAGAANDTRMRHRCQDKKAGCRPCSSTDACDEHPIGQAYNAIARQWFAMPGCRHLGGSQQAFLTGLAHLDNLLPSKRRTQHAGRCGVEVEGGRVPTCDWFLNFQILTSGGLR